MMVNYGLMFLGINRLSAAVCWRRYLLSSFDKESFLQCDDIKGMIGAYLYMT